MTGAQKKTISHLLDELALAYDRDLVLGYSYDDLSHKVVIDFYPRTNLPIQTLVRHIETSYPIEYVHVKNNHTKLIIEIKIGKWIIAPLKSIIRLPK